MGRDRHSARRRHAPSGRRRARSLRPLPRRPTQPPPLPRAREEQELWPGIMAFCRGAGIDPLGLPAEIRATALQQAGQLLRETLVGFTELARTRTDFAEEFRIASGARRRDATGSFAQVSAVEQILEMMLGGRGPGDSRAIDEVRGQFSRVRQHEIAIAAALREALNALFEKLDPDALEEQLGRRTLGSSAPDIKAQLWSRYRDLFRATVQGGDTGLPAVFLAAFARAYESVTAGGSARDPGDPYDRDA